MSRFIDFSGKTIGYLTVLGFSHYDKIKKTRMWNCRCKCGISLLVNTRRLTNRKTPSCGCYNKEILLKAATKHNLCKTRLNRIYRAIKQRCNNPKASGYKNYGLKGIKMCPDWEKSFLSFYNWSIKNGYKDYLTIERKDISKGYSSDNCTWIPLKDQLNNRSNTIFVNYKGINIPMATACEMSGIPYDVIRSRYKRNWSQERLFEPVKKKGKG